MSNVKQAKFGREGTLIALGSSLTIMGSVMVAPILPKMAQEFAPTTPDIGNLLPLIVVAPALAIVLFAPLAGWLSDKFGRKLMLVIATIFYAILGVLPAFQNDLQEIVLTRFIFGCAEAAIMTCCTALIADYWQGNDRLKIVNFQVIAVGVIGALFYVMGGVLGEESWRTPFYLYLLPLLLVPLFIKMLWDPTHFVEPQLLDQSAKVAKGSVISCYLMVFFGMVLAFVVTIQVPSILANHLGVTSTTKIALATGGSMLTSLVGSLIWPLVRRLLGVTGCNAALMTLIAFGLYLLVIANSYEDVLVALVFHGVGIGLLLPNLMASVMSALPDAVRGRGIGGFTACLYLGQFSSPFIVGFLSTGSSLQEAILTLVYAAVAVAIVWVIYRVFVSVDTPQYQVAT
ncbi:MFS transporter [Marinomonas sp. THO17]|uniref:MFS transporter n=1 Tax=Marinomonas sp. THO17 TaxID=3149048 RepID=UPI00336BD589